MITMEIPHDAEIEKVMAETGMARMQAINHLRQRHTLQRERPILSPRWSKDAAR